MPSHDTTVDLVTGAFSYTGAHIAQRLLNAAGKCAH
jgi:NAD(P)-dependent dehydrogenase (short-subunit alcohol dehydrogenase family)